MNILRLNLKKKWWIEINDGRKKWEFRRVTPYWSKRLTKNYDFIDLCLGYPPKGDTNKVIRKKWNGYKIINLKHEEFGGELTKVFAIDLSLGSE